MQSLPLETLRQLAAQVGLAVVAVAGVEELAEDRAFLEAWQRAGYAGEMGYMLRDSGLLAAPQQVVEGAQSVVVFGVHYDRTPRRALRRGHGRVARYAWGRDYHKVLRRRLQSLVELVRTSHSFGVTARIFSDSVPLLERALASRAGLGFVGKNTMVIVPRLGSFLFLAEVLWNLEVTGTAAPQASSGPQHCGSCTRCLSACPTGAFVAERVLDARRCISYLTIEKRGALSVEERRWLGEWVFGCDVCQDVCPFNYVSLKRGLRADIPELGAEAGVGESLSLQEVLLMRDSAAFERRFAGTALMRAKREGLVRNAAVVAANTGASELLGALELAAREDSSAIVRQHALWGYVTLALASGERPRPVIRNRVREALSDPAPEVAAEARQLLEHDA